MTRISPVQRPAVRGMLAALALAGASSCLYETAQAQDPAALCRVTPDTKAGLVSSSCFRSEGCSVVPIALPARDLIPVIVRGAASTPSPLPSPAPGTEPSLKEFAASLNGGPETSYAFETLALLSLKDGSLQHATEAELIRKRLAQSITGVKGSLSDPAAFDGKLLYLLCGNSLEGEQRLVSLDPANQFAVHRSVTISVTGQEQWTWRIAIVGTNVLAVECLDGVAATGATVYQLQCFNLEDGSYLKSIPMDFVACFSERGVWLIQQDKLLRLNPDLTLEPVSIPTPPRLAPVNDSAMDFRNEQLIVAPPCAGVLQSFIRESRGGMYFSQTTAGDATPLEYRTTAALHSPAIVDIDWSRGTWTIEGQRADWKRINLTIDLTGQSAKETAPRYDGTIPVVFEREN